LACTVAIDLGQSLSLAHRGGRVVEGAVGDCATCRASREEPAMKIEGRCHCGQITYEAVVDADKVAICHCSDCQMLTGSAYRQYPGARRDVRSAQRAAEDIH